MCGSTGTYVASDHARSVGLWPWNQDLHHRVPTEKHMHRVRLVVAPARNTLNAHAWLLTSLSVTVLCETLALRCT